MSSVQPPRPERNRSSAGSKHHLSTPVPVQVHCFQLVPIRGAVNMAGGGTDVKGRLYRHYMMPPSCIF